MSTRDRILDGAVAVMRARGLTNTTTKEIAKAAGLSEAMLYKVFRDKTDLFVGVLTERLPRVGVLSGLAEHVGRATVREELQRLTAELLSFYLESFPISASVFSDPNLLRHHREALRERGAGPHLVVEGVTAYLSAEQQSGRVSPTCRPEVVSQLLVGACLHRAFLVRFAGEPVPPDDQVRRFADDVVGALEPTLTGP